MKAQLREWRKEFRRRVLERDKACVMCGWSEDIDKLDPHHITDRNEMPNGGYAPENGITLCPVCHRSAEFGIYSPEELYRKIGSSKEKAVEAARQLK